MLIYCRPCSSNPPFLTSNYEQKRIFLSTTNRNETFYDHSSLNAFSRVRIKFRPCLEQRSLCGSVLAFSAYTQSICVRRCREPFRGQSRGSDARDVVHGSLCIRSLGVDTGWLSFHLRVQFCDASIGSSCPSSYRHTSDMRRASRWCEFACGSTKLFSRRILCRSRGSRT
jgi:hypothetical protein